MASNRLRITPTFIPSNGWKGITMKHPSLRRVLALTLCLCLAVTLLTVFFPIRSASAATASPKNGRQTVNYAPGHFRLSAGTRVQWTTCRGNTMDLNMQNDGNFVLYLNGQPIWASNTSNLLIASAGWATFQTDSNLVVYNYYNTTIPPSLGAAWASGTNGRHATSFSL